MRKVKEGFFGKVEVPDSDGCPNPPLIYTTCYQALINRGISSELYCTTPPLLGGELGVLQAAGTVRARLDEDDVCSNRNPHICSGNKFLEGGGNYFDGYTFNKCYTCTAGSYFNGTNCSDCAAGTYQDASGQSSCKTCDAGYSCAATGQTQCTAGTYAAAGAASCSACVAGEYCPAGTGSSRSCPKGYYCTTISAVNGGKIVCPAGKYNDEFGKTQQTDCKSCDSGDYCPQASEAKNKCAAGSFCPNTSTQTPCTSGNYCPEGSTAQQPCPAGSYCPTPASVIKCRVGTSSPASSTSAAACTPCPAGQYNDVSGSTCKDCSGNGTKWSAAGAASCSDCPANSKCTSPSSYCPTNGPTTDPTCSTDAYRPYRNNVKCNANFYNNSFGTGCIRCPNGATTSGDGQTDKSYCNCP